MKYFPSVETARAFAVSLILLPLLTAAETRIVPGALELDEEMNVASIPGDVADDVEDEAEDTDFVVAPLPSRNPLLGWTLAVPAMSLYRPSGVEADESAWITGLAGFYTENESWGAGAFHRMGLGHDRWQVTLATFYADLNYRYYGIGGGPDLSIPLNQTVTFYLAEVLTEVYPSLYVGLRGSHSQSEVTLDVNIPPDLLPPDITPPRLGVDIDVTTLSPRFKYDTRDNEFYPSDGFYVNGTVDLGRESLGSDSDYEKYKFDVNAYRSFTENTVLAARMAAQYVGGDAPFFVYPAFGSGADLRGYETGTYRDRFLTAVQAELRYRFKPRLGLAAFAGVGTVAPEFARWDKSLASAGAGIRWVIAPNNDMSLRVDVAHGRDGTEFYVGLGEAF